MNKLKLNYFIDLLMAIFFLGTAVSALVLFFFLPSGQRSGYQEFLGILKRNWVDFHRYCGIVFGFLVVIHLILHSKWIFEVSKSMFKKTHLK